MPQVDNMGRPDWLSSDEWIVFISDSQLAPGETEEHAAGAWWQGLRARPKQDMEKDLARIGRQIEDLIKVVPQEPQGFRLTELSFQLAISAEGQLAFIAKAGVNASIAIKFSRA
jgi:hypothetical protein